MAEKIYAGFCTVSDTDPVAIASERLNGFLPVPDHFVMPDADSVVKSLQQKLALAVADKEAAVFSDASGPVGIARISAHSAPGASRWLKCLPSTTLDTSLTNQQLDILVRCRLAVDVHESVSLCPLCSSCQDPSGFHGLSCTHGGDNVTRHNTVRDIVYNYARRGRFDPELARAGLLDEPGAFLHLRRLADVLVDALDEAPLDGVGEFACVALDMKVINSLGTNHLDQTRVGALEATAAYRRGCFLHNRTGERYLAQKIKYEPLVFTAQGGIDQAAEAILSSLADKIASIEPGSDAAAIKSEMIVRISVCLARHAVSKVLRRCKLRVVFEGAHFPALRDAIVGDSSFHDDPVA